MLTTRATYMRFTLNEQIMHILQRFHLDHLGKLRTMKIDRDLITTMVERWRHGPTRFTSLLVR
jgi:hypothetical protein